MGKRAVGAATPWARAIADAIGETQARSGLTNQELFERAGMSASYFYDRMRGAAPFNLNDWDALARALGVHPLELARLAATRAGSADGDLDPSVDVDGTELAKRLTVLFDSPRANGSEFEEGVVRSMLDDRALPISDELWTKLKAGQPSVTVRLRVLETVAEYAGVAARYLTDFEDLATEDAVDAQLELRRAVKAAGGDTALMRAVGDVPPDALRAIAASLRSIKHG